VCTGDREGTGTVEGHDVVAAVAPEELVVKLETGSEKETVLLFCVKVVTKAVVVAQAVVVAKAVVVTKAAVVLLREDTVLFPLLESTGDHSWAVRCVFVICGSMLVVNVLLVELVVVFVYDEASLSLAHIWNMFA
jgi:hypothetical protein